MQDLNGRIKEAIGEGYEKIPSAVIEDYQKSLALYKKGSAIEGGWYGFLRYRAIELGASPAQASLLANARDRI